MAIWLMRRDTSTQWARVNPVIAEGEQALEKDTNKFKIGDGEARWLDLPYFVDENGVAAMIEEAMENLPPGTDTGMTALLQLHIDAPAPHPVYDDGPSFLLLYQNAKV